MGQVPLKFGETQKRIQTAAQISNINIIQSQKVLQNTQNGATN